MKRIKFNWNWDTAWWKATLGSFIATVLGIALTFGVSKMLENKQGQRMQRIAVFNVISDIDQFVASLERDSARCAWLNSWLPDYMTRYSMQQFVPADTVSYYCLESFKISSNFYYRYSPVGKTIIDNATPGNVHDMELYRLINVCYADISKVTKLMEELDCCMNDMVKLTNKIRYERTEFGPDDILRMYMEAPEVHALTNALTAIKEYDMIGLYLNLLRTHRSRILNYAGLKQQEYEDFQSQVKPYLQ